MDAVKGSYSCSHTLIWQESQWVVPGKYLQLSNPVVDVDTVLLPGIPKSSYTIFQRDGLQDLSNRGAYWYEIVFSRAVPDSAVKIKAQTIQDYCDRCRASGIVRDLSYDTQASKFSRVNGKEKIEQQFIIFLLEEVGKHPQYPWLGSRLSKTIGQKNANPIGSNNFLYETPQEAVDKAAQDYISILSQYYSLRGVEDRPPSYQGADIQDVGVGVSINVTFNNKVSTIGVATPNNTAEGSF